MLKGKHRVFLLVLCFFLFCGCWDSNEVKWDLIVSGISVDRVKSEDEENGYLEVGFEFLPMPVGSGQEIEPKLVSIIGPTIQQCFESVIEKSANVPYISHANLVVLSEDIARDSISEVVNTLITNYQYPLTGYVAVCTGETAAEIYESKGLATPILSFEISNAFYSNATHTGKTAPIFAYQIYPYFSNPYAGYLLPAIGILKDEEKGETLPYDEGCAIFLQDKMIGLLTPVESQYTNIFLNKIKNGTFTLMAGPHDTPFTVELIQNKVKKKVTWTDGIPSIDVAFNMKFASHSFPFKQIIGVSDEKVGEKIKENLEIVIEIAQKKAECDFLGISEYLNRFHHKEWMKIRDHWKEIFKDMEINITVDDVIID
ncbi:MAG: Ger(x)C family spore germination protein [Oscillospiraceae bacterium]|jgi:spore germination protein KC|nr:Ger(x)C family spore germination protein [Oscillospiraceae bacterium]